MVISTVVRTSRVRTNMYIVPHSAHAYYLGVQAVSEFCVATPSVLARRTRSCHSDCATTAVDLKRLLKMQVSHRPAGKESRTTKGHILKLKGYGPSESSRSLRSANAKTHTPARSSWWEHVLFGGHYAKV